MPGIFAVAFVALLLINAVVPNAIKNNLTLRQMTFTQFSQVTLYFHICTSTCTWNILCSTPYSCWELRSDRSSWKCPEQSGEDPGGQQGFSNLCCVSPSFCPISIPFSSNLKVKTLRVTALKASMATYHKHKCLLPFEVLSCNRALNFILGKIGLLFYWRLSRSSGKLQRELSFPELRPTQACSVGDRN